ncbi:MAG: hypothetical protein AAFR90_08995 [Pseudomonadota bacterium]
MQSLKPVLSFGFEKIEVFMTADINQHGADFLPGAGDFGGYANRLKAESFYE